MTRKTSAFTLIELLVVISIVALLSSVVLASLNAAREKGRIAAGKALESQIYHAIGSEIGGYWNFNEGVGSTIAKDVSGNGLDGIVSAGATYVTDTPYGDGYSISFTGTANSNVRVNTTSKPAAQAITDPNGVGYTLATWYKSAGPPATASFGSILIREGWHSGLSINTQGRFYGAVYYSDNTATSIMGPSLLDDKWHHLALTVNDTTKRAYLFFDGKQVGDITYTKTLRSYAAAPFLIGGDAYTSPTYSAPGIVDNPMVFGAPIL